MFLRPPKDVLITKAAQENTATMRPETTETQAPLCPTISYLNPFKQETNGYEDELMLLIKPKEGKFKWIQLK